MVFIDDMIQDNKTPSKEQDKTSKRIASFKGNNEEEEEDEDEDDDDDGLIGKKTKSANRATTKPANRAVHMIKRRKTNKSANRAAVRSLPVQWGQQKSGEEEEDYNEL